MSKVDTTVVSDDDIVEITNLLDCVCVYVVEMTGVRRSLPPHASFKVKAEELRQLNYQRGGQELLQNYLRVENEDLAQEFGIDVENTPEYNWGRVEVEAALNDPDINILLDALEFAPAGIKQLIADVAVETEIADVNRRKAISEWLKVDIDSMIKNKHAYDDEDAAEPAPKSTRRRATAKTTTTKTRRTKKTVETVETPTEATKE